MLAKKPGERPTLAAVRTVIKRITGSVIPTLTQAQEQLRAATEPKPDPAPSTEAPTRNERPNPDEPSVETSPETPTRKSAPRTAAVAMNAMPAHRTDMTTSPAGSLRLPRMLSKGTPATTPKRPASQPSPGTPPTYEVEIREQQPVEQAPPSSRGLVIGFVIAAIAVVAGGLVLGMSL
jgi:hypothetical protein